MRTARKKSGRECFVCRHRECAAINLSIARGVSLGSIAKRHKLGYASVYRHSIRPHCFPPELKAKLLAGPTIEGTASLEKLKNIEGESLLLHLINLRHRLFAALDTAEYVGDGGMLSKVSGQLHHNFEITGRLLGDLGTNAPTYINNNNILILPSYIELRVELVNALAAFPEARTAVAQVLHTLEQKAIEADTKDMVALRAAA
jgi:hypothetical protein